MPKHESDEDGSSDHTKIREECRPPIQRLSTRSQTPCVEIWSVPANARFGIELGRMDFPKALGDAYDVTPVS
jgi:hypothetical protein